MNVAVIIPSLNPDGKLVEVVDSLVSAGFDDIIVVNDGSDSNHMQPFDKVRQYKQCTVLKHDVNKGKGRALKTAFEYCIANRTELAGVVTVDGDNQHKAKDILNCCQKMLKLNDKVILGVRDFSGKHVPSKSRFGNNITSFVFRFACGIKISDTQTGLRAIPYEYLPVMCKISGERFEYETNMLLEMKRHQMGMVEVPIETVYIEENASTHFHPIKDSFKIYAVILKYLFGSFASFLIDIAIFTAVNFLLLNVMEASVRIFVSTLTARTVSSIFNYCYNRNAVFEHSGRVASSVLRYYTLCVVQLCMSYGMVYFITKILSLGPVLTTVAKAAVDTVLFIISFQIQRIWVFRK